MAKKKAATSSTATPAPASTSAPQAPPPRGKVTLEPGRGSKRKQTCLFVLYGPPKCRKTTACSTITGAKWIVCDSNCIPVLRSLNRCPPDEDIYEVGSPTECKELIEKMIEAASNGGLEIPAVVFDSMTVMSDWIQHDLTEARGETFLGEKRDDYGAGYRAYYQELGSIIDALAELSRYVTVVTICHAKQAADAKKGNWGGLNLPGQMADYLAKAANCIMFQRISSSELSKDDVTTKSDDYVTVGEPDERGVRKAIEVVIHTETFGLWTAGVCLPLSPEEPADMLKIMRKGGLL